MLCKEVSLPVNLIIYDTRAFFNRFRLNIIIFVAKRATSVREKCMHILNWTFFHRVSVKFLRKFDCNCSRYIHPGHCPLAVVRCIYIFRIQAVRYSVVCFGVDFVVCIFLGRTVDNLKQNRLYSNCSIVDRYTNKDTQSNVRITDVFNFTRVKATKKGNYFERRTSNVRIFVPLVTKYL